MSGDDKVQKTHNRKNIKNDAELNNICLYLSPAHFIVFCRVMQGRRKKQGIQHIINKCCIPCYIIIIGCSALFLTPVSKKFSFLHLQKILPEGEISGKRRICIRGKGCQTGGYGFILGSVCKIYIPQGFRKSPIDILSAPDTILIIAGEIPCGVRFLFIGRIVAFKALRQNVFKGLGIGSVFLSA